MKRCLQGNECIEYEKFIKQNNLYKESKIQSLFSGITKSYSSGTCKFCYKNIENISFNFFIDINIYLDTINAIINFSDVLKSNFGDFSDLSIECKFGKEKVIK